MQVESAAVLFADIVAFKGLAKGWAPADTIDFLRRFQRPMATNVFLDNGAVAQYSGDSIMATIRCAAAELAQRHQCAVLRISHVGDD